MTERWAIHLFRIALFGLIVIAGFGQAVLHLWNLLAPEIFGLPRISFWQAVGLLCLSWLLFGGWRGWGGGRRWRHEYQKMTPEERQKLREGLRQGCAGRRQPQQAEPGV